MSKLFILFFSITVVSLLCKENVKEDNSLLKLVQQLLSSSALSIKANPQAQTTTKTHKKCRTTDCMIFNGCEDCWKRSSTINNETSARVSGTFPTGQNKPCIFPFVHRDRTFVACTNWCPDPCDNVVNYCMPNYWCATELYIIL